MSFQKHYEELLDDIYDQPDDGVHLGMAYNVFIRWVSGLDISTVLDIGCGEGGLSFLATVNFGLDYTGVAKGKDVIVAKGKGINVVNEDFNFLSFKNNSFDVVFARHVLEHSPMPVLTLMEWQRVSKKYLCLIAPNPDYYGWTGRNHYSVANQHQLVWWLRRAGWMVLKARFEMTELQFLCVKKPRLGYEGYADIPLSEPLYALLLFAL